MKINDNEADLEEFNAEYDKYPKLKGAVFKNEAAVRQYNTLKADMEYCYGKREEYTEKLKETNGILNAMVIDTTLDDDTTDESSIDEALIKIKEILDK